jgi:3',5'-cyclic AMP phosphodiesterase CpdA
MLKFIHLTDTHLVTPGQALYGTDPKWRLQRALAAINERHGDSRFMVVPGDLAHWGEPAAYGALSECLGQLRMPVHLLIGNHDDRAAFSTAFPAAPRDGNGFVQLALQTPAGLFVMLDTNEPGTHAGRLCTARLDWLAAALAIGSALTAQPVGRLPFSH